MDNNLAERALRGPAAQIVVRLQERNWPGCSFPCTFSWSLAAPLFAGLRGTQRTAGRECLASLRCGPCPHLAHCGSAGAMSYCGRARTNSTRDNATESPRTSLSRVLCERLAQTQRRPESARVALLRA